MCAVSNIGDYGRKTWPTPGSPLTPGSYPTMPPLDQKPWVPLPGQTFVPPPYNGPTKDQFEEFLELLRAARKFDVKTGQADCPAESKTAWMREMAKLVGVDPAKVDEILKGK